jgi:hypothetical protein
MTASATLEIFDESDKWTNEDLQDVSDVSLKYADEFVM